MSNNNNDIHNNKILYCKNKNNDNKDNNKDNNKKLNFMHYFIPIICYRRFKKLKFLDKFIQIYRRKLSLENILEIIFNVKSLANAFEEMKDNHNNIQNLGGIH